MIKTFSSLILIIFLSLFNFTTSADQNDSRLDNLFKELKRANDQENIKELISDIWNIWYQADDLKVIEYFEKGIQAMQLKNYPLAIRFFNNLIDIDPNFAEAWNKRATVHFIMGNFDQSMKDIKRTLDLEPRHFGALDGMSLIFIHQKEYEQAIGVYDKMLEIFPYSISIIEKKESILSLITQSI